MMTVYPMQIVAREQIFNEATLHKALSELTRLESQVHMENAIFLRLKQLIGNAQAVRAAEMPDAASLQSSVASVLQLKVPGA
jgi:muramoyltetrapeptide carboxypeptidase LdcA involved in peptidoglycan recycling